MSTNQPGPYGEPPAQQPGQPGYGYPPQPPAGAPGQPPPPPQGAPQQPGQPGVPPQQPGYGYPQQPPAGGGYPGYPQQPGMPMPPQGGGNKGKTIGITVGAIAVVAAIVGGVLFFTGGDDDENDESKGGSGDGGSSEVQDDGKKYKLTTPKTVAGTYTKEESSTGGGLKQDEVDKFEKFGVKNAKGTKGEYSSDSGASKKALSLQGVWGEVENPEAAVDAAFSMLEQEAKQGQGMDGGTGGGGGMKAELEGEPQTMKPSGADDAVVKCQNAKFEMSGSSDPSAPSSFTLPVCMWGDNSTVAYISLADQQAALQGGTPKQEAADMLAKVRKDVRVEVS